jgi:hypothetical protein
MIIRIGRKYRLSEWLSKEIASPREVVIMGSSNQSITFRDDQQRVYRIEKSIFLSHAEELQNHRGPTLKTEVIAPEPQITPQPTTPTAPTTPVTPITPTTPVTPTTPTVDPTKPVDNPGDGNQDNPYGGNYL